MRSASFASFALAFAGIAFTQRTYNIDPSSVSLADRQYWCDQQKTQCPLLCLQNSESAGTKANTCEPKNLNYACVCSDGISPNLTEYSQTIPFFQCQTFGNQCVDNCGRNNVCADACRADNPCGAQSPAPPNSSILTATAGPTTSGTGSPANPTSDDFSSLDGQSGGNSNNNNNQGGGTGAASNIGTSMGLTILISSFFAGFAVLL